VPPDEYDVVAIVRGLGATPPRRIALAPSATADVGRLELPERAGSLVGIVRDGRGEPVAGATVRVTASTGHDLAVATDAAGRFDFARVPVGRHRVDAGGIGVAVIDEVEVVAGERAEIEIVPTYDEGVADAVDGDPTGEDEGDDGESTAAGAEDELEWEAEAGSELWVPDLVVEWQENGYVVLALGSRASGGLLPGDVIVAIDGRPAPDQPLLGPRGPVRLLVLRPATARRFETSVERSVVYEEGGC
jgi:hypothetical protein